MSTVRIGNFIYRRIEAQSMTMDQAEQVATEVARDIGSLALFMREQKMPNDEIAAVEKISQTFAIMADRIAKQSLKKAASPSVAYEDPTPYEQQAKEMMRYFINTPALAWENLDMYIVGDHAADELGKPEWKTMGGHVVYEWACEVLAEQGAPSYCLEDC